MNEKKEKRIKLGIHKSFSHNFLKVRRTAEHMPNTRVARRPVWFINNRTTVDTRYRRIKRMDTTGGTRREGIRASPPSHPRHYSSPILWPRQKQFEYFSIRRVFPTEQTREISATWRKIYSPAFAQDRDRRLDLMQMYAAARRDEQLEIKSFFEKRRGEGGEGGGKNSLLQLTAALRSRNWKIRGVS